jgi:hypothetical protein
MRTRALVLLAAVVTGVSVVAGTFVDRHDHARPVAERPVNAAESSPQLRALGVLHAWDRRRSAAWAAGDPAALSLLYTRRSQTGARDVRRLERWRERGLRVVGLRQQVAALRLRRRSPGMLCLVVTDRTVEGVASGPARHTALPRSAWSTHRITLRHVHGAWRVVEVVTVKSRAQPAR